MKPLTTIVTKNLREAPDIVTVYFTLPNGSTLDYSAGQYVTVYFEGSSTPEGKAYSLSSMPSEPEMSITVKVIGEFSRKIASLKPGDNLHISEAYGNFGPITKQPLVCFTAGVGLSPVWSIVKHLHETGDKRQVQLCCSTTTVENIPFNEPLRELVCIHDALHVSRYVTRQSSLPSEIIPHRIDFSRYIDPVADRFYLLCGSDDFVRSAWQELTHSGVAARNISTETFFAS